MAMAFLFAPAVKLPRRRSPAADNSQHATSRLHGKAYLGILARHDDRLIRDIGLTREEIMGPEKTFWSQWLKQKEPWQL